MDGSAPALRFRRLAAALLSAALVVLSGAPLAAANDPADAGWASLHEQSRQAIASIVDSLTTTLAVSTTVATDELAVPTVVVGFTGGLERRDSRVSGVVRLRHEITEAAREADVTALAYNNFSWREATRDVLAFTRRWRDEATAAATIDTRDGAPPLQPILIVYGHSWGAGAIGKFARALRKEGIEIALAVYIDAFTVRAPRVPDNVRYAVNVYQRAGVLRGWPLRGKSSVVAESPEATTVLANLRVTPDSGHFGWNWNLVQPLLYRQHHRLGHDVRIRQFLLDVLPVRVASEERDTDGQDVGGQTGDVDDCLPA